MAVKLLVHIMILVISICPIYLHVSAKPMTKPGCNSRCGHVDIPYPFGMNNRSNSDCYADKWFEIECRNVKSADKPYLKSMGVEVTFIGLSEGTVEIMNPIYRINCGKKDSLPYINMGGGPFVYSQKYNKFVAVGCNNIVFLQSNGSDVGGCVSICDNKNHDMRKMDLQNSECHGESCCETSLPSKLSEYSAKVKRLIKENQTGNHCSYAMIVRYCGYLNNHNYYPRWYDKLYYPIYYNTPDCNSVHHYEPGYGGYNSYYFPIRGVLKDINEVPAVLQWEIQNKTLKLPADDDFHYCHFSNVTSYHSGRTCTCRSGFYGNPYIAGGCIDWSSYSGSGSSWDWNPERKQNSNRILRKQIITGVFASIGSIILVLVLWRLYKVVSKKIVRKVREKFFKRNGGLLLKQRMSSGEVKVDEVKLFSLRDLEKATDNFNKNRILGKGGQGTVYKGMLVDGKIVAVKMFKVNGKIEEFINEFIILSQINHRNVVKLLGSCLETKIPLLVYEFIPNGNLFEYLHEQNEDLRMTWDMRLRIGTEIAGALFYLHSFASLPIYHRDIKSTNILLDEKYRAKVADFGTSRMVSVEVTHLTTVVQGTFGYLDPEYFHTSQFTEKSDVYSFGVLLVELLTGQKPISSLRPEETRSLAPYFVLCMEENRLFDIIDERVTMEAKKEHIIVIANLASRCLELNGKKRPTMKEVTLELEGIRKLERKDSTQERHDELDVVPIEDYQSWAEYPIASNIRSTFDVNRRTPSLEDIHLLTI